MCKFLMLLMGITVPLCAVGPLTQSEAHLSAKNVQEHVSKVDRTLHAHIQEAAFQNERKLNNDYDIVYTAIPNMRVFQDITAQLYKRVVGKTSALKEFKFIRYQFKDPIYDQYKNVTEFLIDEIQKNGIVDDNEIRLKTILISANLAFFGNEGLEGESTWNYFNTPQPWVSAPWLKFLLESSLKSFGYSTQFVPELLELSKSIQTTTGDLFQICIPHQKTDDIGYLSWRQGIPFDVKFINTVFKRVNMSFGRGDKIFHEEINERITLLKEQWKQRVPQTVQLVTELLENVKAGKYRLAPFLEKYKKSPETLPYINAYQARLLITNNLLLNPESGIKIYRFSTLSPDKEAHYKAQLKDILARMDAEKVQRTGIANL